MRGETRREYLPATVQNMLKGAVFKFLWVFFIACRSERRSASVLAYSGYYALLTTTRTRT